jgi:predicted SAM-dependent methyltransferase
VDAVLDLETSDPTAQFPPASVDRILISHVLEHLRDPYRTLKQAHDILKPGGVLEIRVPNRDHMNAHSILHYHYFEEYSATSPGRMAVSRTSLLRCG